MATQVSRAAPRLFQARPVVCVSQARVALAELLAMTHRSLVNPGACIYGSRPLAELAYASDI